MDVIGYALIGVAAFAVLISVVFYILNKQKGSGRKYPFILYNTDGSQAKKIEAKIEVDSSNKTKRVFSFEAYATKLPIKPPSFQMGKESYREVTLGQKGELVYIERKGIDKEKYLNTSMSSEDVAVYTGMILENNREFENPMTKSTTTLILSMVFIAFLIVVGCVYSTITLVNNSGTMLEIAKENSKSVNGIESSANTMNSIAEQLTMITAALTSDANLTRRLT